MRALGRLAALMLLAWGAAAQAAAPSAHYDVEMKLSPRHDALDAQVVITLPAGQAQGEQVFLLGDRFHVRSADAGPGIKVAVTPTDQPFPHLRQVSVAFPKANKAPGRVRIAYDGPLDGGAGFDKIVQDGFLEFRIDAFWLPIRNDIGLYFTADTHISGLPSGMDVAAQGQVRERGTEAWLHRPGRDMDLAFVVINGLKQVSAPGVDFHAADLDSPLVRTFRRHAVAAAAFHQAMLGPMPRWANGDRRRAPHLGQRLSARRLHPAVASQLSGADHAGRG
jgi:hypothetical protein